MKEIFECKCGKASASFEPVGEDLYDLEVVNTTIKREGYGKNCICKLCGEKYTEYDPCMVNYVEFKS